MHIRKIIVGTDFGQSGRRAVQLATSTAEATGASLSLVHACETSFDYGWPDLPVGIRPAVRALRERFQNQLQDSAEVLEEERGRCEQKGVPCEGSLEEGHPWETILHAATSSEASLIVVGDHNEASGMSERLLGSTAERVVRHAQCSVLVACGRLAKDYHGAHILVGVDFSEHGLSSLRWGKHLANVLNGRITLLHVVPHPVTQRTLPKEWDSVREAMKETATVRLEELIKKEGLDPGTPMLVLDGQVGAALCNQAAELEADLLVVGTRGQSRLRDMMIGGTSRYCLRYSPVPVLAARP